MIDLVFIAFNRLDYTRLALESVLADPNEEFNLTLWDNGSTDGTREYLAEVSDPRIVDRVLCEENQGQVAPVNHVWSRARGDLVGKLDNDCLLTPGWTRTLAAAHRDIPELGALACWHFFEDDFDYEKARHKIESRGGHQIFRHPWTCGTGLLVKTETYRQIGPMEGRSTTAYWMKLAIAGYVNGFYYPLVFQEHMDDLKSRYCELNTEEGYEQARRTTMFERPEARSRERLWRWRKQILANLHEEPYDPSCYLGWRGRAWRFRNRIRLRIGASGDR